MRLKNTAITIIVTFFALFITACAAPAQPAIEAEPVGDTAPMEEEAQEPIVITATPEPITEPVYNFTQHSSTSSAALPKSGGGDWESNWTFAPSVVYHHGAFHMFYTGLPQLGIGYATSEDGLTFERFSDEPILTLDDEDLNIQRGVVAVAEDGTWHMVVGIVDGNTLNGQMLGHATAPAPEGPWTLDPEPIYQTSTASWDARMVPHSFLIDENGFRVYYDGRPLDIFKTGVVFSEDGETWEVYNDPATDGRYADSDPVMGEGSEDAWDQAGVASPMVLKTADGYEMFYTGLYDTAGRGVEYAETSRALIGYATSPDGIHWERNEDNPIAKLTNESALLYMAALNHDDQYYLYWAIKAGGFGIGVMTGEITWP